VCGVPSRLESNRVQVGLFQTPLQSVLSDLPIAGTANQNTDSIIVLSLHQVMGCANVHDGTPTLVAGFGFLLLLDDRRWCYYLLGLVIAWLLLLVVQDNGNILRPYRCLAKFAHQLTVVEGILFDFETAIAAFVKGRSHNGSIIAALGMKGVVARIGSGYHGGSIGR